MLMPNLAQAHYLDFTPLPGLFSCHVQTLLGAFRHAPKGITASNLKVELGGGDFLSCEVTSGAIFSKIVLLVHGLGGSQNSSYMLRLAKRLSEKGMMAVRVNLRGCGSGEGLSSLPYHAGRSDDLFAVVQALHKLHPTKEIHVTGFSLGANLALKLAGEAPSHIAQTIAICPPLDLAKTVAAIQKPMLTLYHRYYLKKLSQQAVHWCKTPIRTLYEFDNTITAPLWGFSSADDYYRKSSCKHYLSQINHPCQILFAEDDPFIPLKGEELSLSPYVQVWLTKRGGHLGFQGYTEKEYNYFWLDQQIFRFLDVK